MAKNPAGIASWDPFRSSLAYWNWFSHTSDIWWTRQQGQAAISAAIVARFDALVRFARRRSPFYRTTYRSLPAEGFSLADLPPLSKSQLMASFDEWVTDPAVSRSSVEGFVGDPALVGEQYLGRYAVWKSSGSTGEPGIFLHEADALATYDALIAAPLATTELAANYTWGLLAEGGRAALIAATGAHFASIASWQRLVHSSPWQDSRVFSVMTPLARLMSELNTYQPAFLASYPTVLAQLAEEQDSGRLRIHPKTLWSGGECLTPAMQKETERAFGCAVVNEYGASECLSIAFGCRHGWLHINADWVILEPVDAEYRPVPAGEISTTTLLTNLANYVQPIIRYDLGDSIMLRPDRCPCGSPLPAICVEGRADDVLALRAENAAIIRVPPMAVTTVVEEATGVHRFQIEQTGPDRLALRLGTSNARDADTAWRSAYTALHGYLVHQGLANVRISRDRRAPRPDPLSGKLRQVVKTGSRQAPSPHSCRE